MNHPHLVALVRKIIARLDDPPVRGDGPVGHVAAATYASEERFLAERAHLFADMPVIVAHESELAHAGACLGVEIAGVSVLVVRGADGALRAFKNACRHRSTRLVADEAPCTKKAFVCPYHGWTYDLAGRLVHVPHAASFSGEDRSRSELAAVHAETRHGFVYASLAPFDAAAHLGAIDDELGSLGVPDLAIYRRTTREVRGNWKLIIDAFLDGYHIRHLHRDSVYPFFLDARSEVEQAGDHFRAVSARKAILEARSADLETAPLRDLVTPSYVVFPNAVFVLHPDSFSVMTSMPLAADRTRFVHTLLVPAGERSPAAEAHYAKTFALIDEGVFAREDLATVEAMQRGIATGANETLLFGELEHAALSFHASVAAHVG